MSNYHDKYASVFFVPLLRMMITVASLNCRNTRRSRYVWINQGEEGDPSADRGRQDKETLRLPRFERDWWFH
jgi:hypothetical protein